MIIDMRVRPPIEPWVGKPQFQKGRYYPARFGFPRPASAEKESIELLFAEMDQAEVRWAVVSGRRAAEPLGVISNDQVADVVGKYPSRFVAFAGIDVNQTADSSITEIDRCLAIPGFKGIAIEPAAAVEPMMLDDRRLYPIYDHCTKRRVPLSITISAELANLVSHPPQYASPLPLYQPARTFRELQFVIAHAAWPAVQEVLGLAFALPNIWLSPDLYMVGTDMPFAAEYVKAAKLYLADRTVFGTGYPSRPHVDSVRAFKQWGLEPDLERKILYQNAFRLLHMDA